MGLFEHAASKLLEDEFGAPDELPDEEIEDENLPDYASMDMNELTDLFFEKNDLWGLDGERGIENFEELLKAIGYGDSGGWGSSDVLREFLGDNPAVMEHLVQWICDAPVIDWKENLINNMHGV